MKTFSEFLAGQEVNFYVLCMKQSFLIWAGADRSFSALSVAMNTRFVGHLYSSLIIKLHPLIYIQECDPISTHLLGDPTNTTSSSLSKRLGTYTTCVSVCMEQRVLCVYAYISRPCSQKNRMSVLC